MLYSRKLPSAAVQVDSGLAMLPCIATVAFCTGRPFASRTAPEIQLDVFVASLCRSSNGSKGRGPPLLSNCAAAEQKAEQTATNKNVRNTSERISLSSTEVEFSRLRAVYLLADTRINCHICQRIGRLDDSTLAEGPNPNEKAVYPSWLRTVTTYTDNL
jgi:hypothetical protein